MKHTIIGHEASKFPVIQFLGTIIRILTYDILKKNVSI